MEVTIKITEWMIYVFVIWLSLYAVDLTLSIYGRWLKWKIKKMKQK